MRITLGGAALYAALFGAVALGYRSFVFPRTASGLEPALSGTTLLRLDAGGIPAVALWAAPRGDRAVIVFFHGNGEELVDLVPLARELMDHGLGILFVEYPGYGLAAAGRATEENLYRAAERSLVELASFSISPDRTVLVGHSLGTGVAVEMARRGYGDRMILISPYTSMTQMVKRFVPVLPVSMFVRDRFDNLAKAPGVKQETVVVHGDRDRLIPIEMARVVAQALPSARLEVFEGGSHNDLFQREEGRLLQLIVASGEQKRSDRSGARRDHQEAAAP